MICARVVGRIGMLVRELEVLERPTGRHEVPMPFYAYSRWTLAFIARFSGCVIDRMISVVSDGDFLRARARPVLLQWSSASRR
jgi:hypothetical protein